MVFCTNCGNQIADGVKFCTSCGTPMPAVATAPTPPAASVPASTLTESAAPVVEQQLASTPVQPAVPPVPPVQQTAQQPLYAAPPAAAYQEAPISTGGYIGILLLLMLPVVNLVCLIIWACGGCAKCNKTNLSRALLVWLLIGTVLGGLAFLAGSLFFSDALDLVRELGSQINRAAVTE